MQRLLCRLAALGLFVSISGQVKADYIFTPIDVPGATFTTVAAINNGGQIVGSYANHGFLYSNGSSTTLDVPGSYGGPFGVDFTVASGLARISPFRHCSIFPEHPRRLPPKSTTPATW
ncbi:MAG TPA: hypothetical protein VKU02_16690 [Gemmataceae bacterium]|nr:hypothetical protein [Gemmataceae bacterium]